MSKKYKLRTHNVDAVEWKGGGSFGEVAAMLGSTMGLNVNEYGQLLISRDWNMQVVSPGDYVVMFSDGSVLAMDPVDFSQRYGDV